MKKSLNIIFLVVLFNIQITYTAEKNDPFKHHEARMKEILETEKKYSHIFDMTKIKEMEEERFLYELDSYAPKTENTKHEDKKIHDKEIVVPIKQHYLAQCKTNQYLEPGKKSYVNPHERKYKVYIIDTNPRLKNMKVDSDSSNSDSSDSDSSISSGSVKKNKIKTPQHKIIKVIEKEKIISIHRTRFQELVNIFYKSPKWSIAKMFDDHEVGIAIEEYINETIQTQNKKLMHSNNIKQYNNKYQNNYAKPTEFKTAQEGYNILVNRLNNIINEFNQIPNMQANLNNISLQYRQDSITQNDVDKLNTIICTLGKILTREKVNQRNFIKNNVMSKQKFLTPKK